MKKDRIHIIISLSLISLLLSCSPSGTEQSDAAAETEPLQEEVQELSPIQKRLSMYETVQLTTDLTQLSEAEKKMIPLLIKAAKIMDELFWHQTYGTKDSLFSKIQDEDVRRLAEINYGPWDRLDGNTPFVEDAGHKSAGANFYPHDMTKEEFEKASTEGKKDLYTMLHWNSNYELVAVPYSSVFSHELEEASGYLKQAAELAEDPGLKKYLTLRAEALLTDKFTASDMAWLDMKDNTIDVIIGPIEHYEDNLFGYKTAYESYILVKDKEWSKRLERYIAFLPELQNSLPVPDDYKSEKPGTDSDLNAYDVIYYAGDCNSGGKTIAINLPNDEEIQKSKGTRRLQLKNTMRAKFDKILLPIADELISEDQRPLITFDAFFSNTMFHEVAHGLGIKTTITGKGTVREALQEQASALEEGKADILGLYMVGKLYEMDELHEGKLEENYVTFLASIFRSIRFGASSAHGKANMLRLNFLLENGAVVRDRESGTYSVDFEKMKEAVSSLSSIILKLQGDGDYDAVVKLMEEKGGMSLTLQNELASLVEKGIPIDIVFEQGLEVLGLPDTENPS